MTEPSMTPEPREETPVDDVRRVRRRLHSEAGGSVHRLVEASRQAAEKYRDALNLKPVRTPESPNQTSPDRP